VLVSAGWLGWVYPASPSSAPVRAGQSQRSDGYSRCKGRPSHLCFKTVLASFPAHGSSMTESLSWRRCIYSQRSVNLSLQQRRNRWASSRRFHQKVQRYPWVTPCATGSFTFSVIAFTSAKPLAFPEAWLLEGALPVVHAVDTCSRPSWRATTGVLRSLLPSLFAVGSYHAPGFVRGVPRA